MSSSLNKKVPNFWGRVLIKSSFKPPEVASLIAARLIPGGAGLVWKDLNGEEITLLGISGVVGGDFELQGDERRGYVFTYQTDVDFLIEQEDQRGIKINPDDFEDVTPLLLYALGKIPGLEIEGVDLSR